MTQFKRFHSSHFRRQSLRLSFRVLARNLLGMCPSYKISRLPTTSGTPRNDRQLESLSLGMNRVAPTNLTAATYYQVWLYVSFSLLSA
jgi:hypothetical protein